MAPRTRCLLCSIASGTCLALVAQFALSTTLSAGEAKQATSTRPSVALPAPIPADALDKMPLDATAYCHDATWSNAGTKTEACSNHAGVMVWFGPAPQGTTGRCKNGTYTRARKGTYGACSGSGGVRTWFSQAVPATPGTP